MNDAIQRKAETFRALHQSPGCFIVANAWDAGSARLLSNLGFPAIATTSAGYAWSMAKPDGLSSRDEIIANARGIAAVTALPVTADLLNGFGDTPEAVASTIRLAAGAGVVGGSIEDTTGDPSHPVYDVSLARERIVAAVEAARAVGHPFMLTARADGLFARAYGLDEAIRRLQFFEEAGADVVYAPGIAKKEQLHTLMSALRAPVNVLAGISPHLSVADLREAGVRRISFGSALFSAAAGAFIRAAKETLDDGTFGWSSLALGYASIEAQLRDPAGQ